MLRRVGYLLVGLTAALTFWQIVSLRPKLPVEVASHFNLAGKADGWMTRGGFMRMHCFMQLAMAALMLGIAFGIRRIPESLLNMPNKAYWLHPDRREESLNYNASLMIFVAGATGVFLVFVFQLIYQANVQNGGRLSSKWMGALLGGYLFTIAVVSASALWRFRMPR